MNPFLAIALYKYGYHDYTYYPIQLLIVLYKFVCPYVCLSG